MNIVDIVVVVLIGLYVLNGLYRGFIPSLINLGGFFLSWIISFLTYPLLSPMLAQNKFLSSFMYYIEGAEWIGDYELARTSIDQISSAKLSAVMTNAKLPPPFDQAITINVQNQAFASDGVTSLGDYFNLTIFNVMINILSILIIFVVLRVIFTLIGNGVSYAFNPPQLRHFDMPLGGASGLFRGYFSMYMIFMLIPVSLIMLSGTEVSNIVNSSSFCGIFYSGSILLRFVSGVI